VGELWDWIHLDAIQALIHHASAVVTAIFIFALTARLITHLIPDGHAKKLVIIIDDVILLAVFALAGYRLLNYMWVRPHMEDKPGESAEIGQLRPPVDEAREASHSGTTLPECRALAKTSDELQQCLKQKLAQAQQALEQSSERMSADMKALDRVGSAKIGARKTFEAAQQAFVQYREAECKWRSTTAAGAGADEVYTACMADLTSARTERLQALLK